MMDKVVKMATNAHRPPPRPNVRLHLKHQKAEIVSSSHERRLAAAAEDDSAAHQTAREAQ